MADVAREHGASGALAHQLRQRGDQAISRLAAQREHQARLGAELAHAEREGGEQSLRDGIAARAHGIGQQEGGIDAAHLRKHGDGMRARGGRIEQRATCRV
jgi:hypothetical protein